MPASGIDQPQTKRVVKVALGCFRQLSNVFRLDRHRV
jgi:hypothetical protein